MNEEIKKNAELTDDLLVGVAGGTTIAGEVPPEAKAEGLDFGVEIISDWGCDKCGCKRSRVIDFPSNWNFRGECTGCKTIGWAILKSAGGGGWTIA